MSSDYMLYKINFQVVGIMIQEHFISQQRLQLGHKLKITGYFLVSFGSSVRSCYFMTHLIGQAHAFNKQ